jgi:hypothetical protein
MTDDKRGSVNCGVVGVYNLLQILFREVSLNALSGRLIASLEHMDAFCEGHFCFILA